MNDQEKTILVTGATGTVGSEVVKQLTSISPLSSGHKIRAAVHSKNKADKLKQFDNKRVEIVELDYAKPETVADALNKVDNLYLQTLPIPDVTDICSNLVKEAKKNNVKYIVKLSAMGADSSQIYNFTIAWRRRKNNSGLWNSLYLLTPSCIYAKFCNSIWSYNKNPKCILCSCRRCKDEFCRR
jgi:nucleoside-diphosphate-sugar epimerase